MLSLQFYTRKVACRILGNEVYNGKITDLLIRILSMPSQTCYTIDFLMPMSHHSQGFSSMFREIKSLLELGMYLIIM